MNKAPLGVKVFASLLVFASIYQLMGFLNYSYYKLIFQQLPQPLIEIRYSFSIILRFVSLICGVGLFYLNEKCRILAIGLSLISLGVIYWKHPYYAFKNVAVYTEQMYYGTTVQELVYPSFPVISMAVHLAIDIIFAGAVIYYFTRPKIKRLFTTPDE